MGQVKKQNKETGYKTKQGDRLRNKTRRHVIKQNKGTG